MEVLNRQVFPDKSLCRDSKQTRWFGMLLDETLNLNIFIHIFEEILWEKHDHYLRLG